MKLVDRILRILIGCIVVYLFGFFCNHLPLWPAIIGVVLILSGAAGYCPAYKLLDRPSSLSKKNRAIRSAVGLLWIVGFSIAGSLGMCSPWWALIGLIPLVIGRSGRCPACSIFGRCSIKK